MRITFIRPNIGKYRVADAIEPIVFAILKSLTPQNIQCTLFDDRIEEIDYDLPTDAVVITVETFTALRSYEIAKKFQDKGIPVIMGGFHPTIMPHEVSKYADTVIIGDAEPTWPQVSDDLINADLKKEYRAPADYSIKGIVPDRSIFNGKSYNPVHLVQYTRGCRFNCSFCSIHAFYKKNLLHRNIEDVVNEFKTLKYKTVFFADDNLFSKKDLVVELLSKIKPIKKKWMAQVSIDIAKDKSLLKLMKESGCFALLIGFESLNEKNLKELGKSWNKKVMNYEEAIKTIQSFGIMVHGTFIVGNGEDTPKDIRDIFKFAMKNNLFLAHFNPLTPTPGTQLYKDLESKGELLYKNWWLNSSYEYGTPMFMPKKMSPDTFEKTVFDVRKEFNSWLNIFKRTMNLSVLKSPFNLGIFLLANKLTRKELYKKQNIKLGMQ